MTVARLRLIRRDLGLNTFISFRCGFVSGTSVEVEVVNVLTTAMCEAASRLKLEIAPKKSLPSQCKTRFRVSVEILYWQF